PRRRVAPARATTVGPRRPSRLCCGPGPRGSAARGPAALRPGRAARPPGALSPAPARPPGSGRWSHRPYTWRQMAAWGLSGSLPLAVGPAVRPVRRPRAGSRARAVFLDVGASAREEAVVSPSVHLAADGRLAVVLVPATGRGSGCAACSAVPGGLPGTGRVSRCRRVRPGAGRGSPSVYLAADGRLGAVRVPPAVGLAERADVGALAEGRSRPGGRLGGTG